MHDQKIPSARKQGLIIQQAQGDTLVYDTHRHQAHCLNENAALIWVHCDGKHTVSDLSEVLRAKADNASLNKNEYRDMIWVALGQLEEANLLEAPIQTRTEMKGLTRRQLMKAA